MVEALIELKNTSFAAQEKMIIEDLAMSFEAGKVTAMIGPSGGGKSTALKLAAGLLVPSAGEVYYKGSGISTMSRADNLCFRRESAFVFQDSALWANQNLSQILELPLKIHCPKMTIKDRRDRIREVIAEVGYRKSLEVRPAQLSMGEQKLIAFARALLCKPQLLFLDEWTESLDDAAARRLVNLVRALHEKNTTVVFISHNIRVIRDLAEQVCMIEDGKLAWSVSGAEFAGNPELIKVIEKGIAV